MVKTRKQRKEEEKARWKKYISKKRKKSKNKKVRYDNANKFEEDFNKKFGENANVEKSKVTNRQRRVKGYNKYIRSKAWKEFRLRVIGLRGNKCECCNGEFDSLHVHHIHYKNFTEEQLEDVLVLCEDCHKKMHQLVQKPPYTLEKLKRRL